MNNAKNAGRATWPSRIAAVALDMDGLMLNTEQLYFEVFQTILGRRGSRFTDRLRRGMMGLPGPQALGLLIASEGLNESPSQLQIEVDEVFGSFLPHRLSTMPGLETLLSRLIELRIPRCVATSSRRWFAEHLLQSSGVLSKIDFIITAEDVASGKPAPDIYLSAAQRMLVGTVEMLVLEDSQHGCRSGVASGACTIAVPGEHSRDHDFCGTFAIAESLEDSCILDLFESRHARD